MKVSVVVFCNNVVGGLLASPNNSKKRLLPSGSIELLQLNNTLLFPISVLFRGEIIVGSVGFLAVIVILFEKIVSSTINL